MSSERSGVFRRCPSRRTRRSLGSWLAPATPSEYRWPSEGQDADPNRKHQQAQQQASKRVEIERDDQSCKVRCGRRQRNHVELRIAEMAVAEPLCHSEGAGYAHSGPHQGFSYRRPSPAVRAEICSTVCVEGNALTRTAGLGVRPNPSLERRPSTAGCLARGTAKGHHRSRGQGTRPLRAPQLER